MCAARRFMTHSEFSISLVKEEGKGKDAGTQTGRRSEDATSPLGDESGAVGNAAVPFDPLAHPTSSSPQWGTHAVYRHGEDSTPGRSVRGDSLTFANAIKFGMTHNTQ